jgi:hypothetical protein
VDPFAVIGIVLGLLGLNALWNVPRQVDLHDRLVANLSENLCAWIDDVDDDLGTELTRITIEQIRADQEWPMYLRVGTRQRAKNEAVERLTDKTRESKQERDRIELSEGWEHKLCRRTPWYHPLPELMALEDKADVIEKWRKQVTDEDVDRAEHRAKMIREIAARQAKPTRPTPRTPQG